MGGMISMSIEKKVFGTTKNGETVHSYTITSEGGISVTLIEFGAAINTLFVPDKNGNAVDVVCGYDKLSDYEDGDGYQGAVVGRFGNRIGKGKFTLDGVEYNLYCNNGNNHLHGGKVGFSHKVWNSEAIEEEGADRVIFTLISPDGEENYPGTLNVSVEYRVVAGKEISITYHATTDKKTVLNLTNHTYFNLAGFDSGDVFDHVVYLDADRFVETDAELIPTGKTPTVLNTPFDFRTAKTIGKDWNLEYEPMKLAGGYDHCMIFAEHYEDAMQSPRVIVTEPKSGRKMSVYTDLPSVQFYSANFMSNPDFPFKGGYTQKTQHAFCLETENMPDSMNHEHFTNCVLNPGEEYKTQTVYAFEWKE